uniref:NADH-ubiquinone oxidoreductase chain 4 n=1 Tax=Rhyacophila quadrifida TaxID=2904903 RepID=A0A9E8RU19_9NEOP|nr:NADH dehydrogenase subunit 4 [Rhyacophila quadrifida]UZZ44372.1 NADH dehydrogenase subunit 4 [Rhyacophila quadrifida]
MLKYVFMLVFMVLFNMKMFWMVQIFLFYFVFIFMNLSINLFYFNNLSYILGCDFISYGLILLSIWIFCLMLMASEDIYKKDNYSMIFVFNLLILLLFLVLTFSSVNLLMFYLFFEGSLIPVLFLIIGWGYQPERLQAGIYLLFYTLVVSLPMLLGIFYVGLTLNSFFFFFLKELNMNFNMLYLVMIMAFLVKMPMFFVHLWLPKAHVEAPVSGSMILASIMLKLGGYGLLRVMVLMLSVSMSLNFIWVSISLVGGLILSLSCFFQIDLKSLVAYSSVVHMGVLLSSLMTISSWGFYGSYLLMIGHGLCSSGLFCLVNIIYERTGSRSMLVNKGMLSFMPSMCLWWFLLLSSNMAAPPSMNLLGEINLFMGLVSWSYLTVMFLILISFFSAAYSLYLFSFSQHGKFSGGSVSSSNGVVREYTLLLLHWLPLNFLIMKVEMFVIWF